jgi:NADPH:quinone reductase-like Zn-dependent oxidoreductase
VGQGLYQNIGLPLPPAKVSEPAWILIYGGSTATGTLAIQFAKLSGLKVVATSSPRNFDLLKKLGADAVYDYKEPGVGAKIREATNDSLKLVFDTIAEGSSPGIAADAISSKGGKYASILYVKQFPRDDVRNTWTLAYTSFGEDYSVQFPANQADFEFAARFLAVSEELINSGKIKPHPTEVREGGLEGIMQGLQDLKDGKVSSTKLVYKIE